MRLISWNIQYGFGADGVYNLKRCAGLLATADVIALQEVERHWPRSGFDDQPALLAAMLPGHHFVFGPGYDMNADLTGADGLVTHRRRQFGPMILSRFPINWSRLHLLPMRRMLRPLNTQAAALEAMIHAPGGPLRVWSVHLAHVGQEERLAQIDFLLARNAESARSGGPWSGADDEPQRGWTCGETEPASPEAAIIMGDFNSLPGSHEYQRMTGNQPFHDGALYAGGFADAMADSTAHSHERLRGGETERRRLDYCFVSAGLAGRISSARVDGGNPASDHFPVIADIGLETPF